MDLTAIERAWLSFQAGKILETIGICQGIIQRNTAAANAFYLLAKCYRALGDHATAQRYYQKCIELYPDRSLLRQELAELAIDHFSLGNGCAQRGEYEQAIHHYQAGIRAGISTWEIYFNLGLAYHRTGKFTHAIECYETAIRIDPDRVDSYLNLGALYREQGNYDEAIAIYLKGLQRSPQAALYSNLANVYLLTDRLTEAIENCDRALALDPNCAHAYDIKGACLEQQQQTREAIKLYRLAIEKKPDLANAHFNLAHALLSLGEWEEGWQEYQWRFQRGVLQKPAFEQPEWDGSFLDGKSILLWTEQGYGDTLQFIRYVWYVRERGGKVIVRCPRSLVRLLSLVEGVAAVVAEDAPLPGFDVHASLLDLPRLLGIIPSIVPYLPTPKQELFPPLLQGKGKLKIGIVWQSGDHQNLSSQKLKRHKSTQLDYFLSLLDDRLVFFSLQLGNEQIPEQIIDLSPFITDFADTATIVSHLDLVITIDTAVAHLAGGLGKQVWVLLPFACDWRWLKDRSDSPWYPTMTLFRQSQPGNWTEVFQRVKSSLSHFQPTSLPSGETIFQQGNLFFHQRQYHKAIDAYQRAIHLGYRTIYSYFNLGVVKRNLGFPEQATVYFSIVIQQQPNYAPAYLTLAKSYIDREMLDDAYTAIQTCLKLAPHLPELEHTLGLIYFRQGKNKEAIECYRSALQKNPQDALTHYNLAISLLLEGDYQSGWQEYEWRINAQDAKIKLKQPRWDGSSSLAGKTILVWCEGGFGDTIQFLRYLPFLQTQGASIILACQRQLINLIKQELKSVKLIPYNNLEEDPIGLSVGDEVFDYHLPLMSLPFVLQLDYIPSAIPYLSSYNKEPVIPPQKIGIVWASGYRSTPNLHRLYKQKSCPIDYMMQLLSIPHLQLYSFQVGKDAKDILAFLQDRVIDLSDRLQDFTDTVALLQEMDLLITVDTAIAHLGGAMGMPVWLLLPFAPDWRWLKDRSDSPWYPTMTVFRQKQLNDWQSAIDQVKDRLLDYYRSVLQEAEDLLKKGNQFFQTGQLQEAMLCFQQAIKANPNLGKAYYNLGVVCKQLKMTEEAVWSYQEALKLGEEPALVYFALGNLYLSIDQNDRAKECYELSIKSDPNFLESYISLIEISRRLKQIDEAVTYCHKIERIGYRSARFYNNYALVLIETDQYKLAQEKALLALEIDPSYALAYLTLGHICGTLGELDQAHYYYQLGIAKQPNYAPAYAIYANLMIKEGNYDRAEELYNQALQIDSQLAHAHYGKSNMLLMKGDLLTGWDEYEWRWQYSKISLPPFPFPKWQGEDLTGKSILIYGEQGYGDKIQFIRFVFLLQAKGATVFYLCPRTLEGLFSTIPSLIIVPEDTTFDQLPALDFFIPLMSIPKILGITIDRIPQNIPYLFPSYSKNHLFNQSGLKVGFAWASGRHAGQVGELSYEQKSCSLDNFLSLLDLPNLFLFSLQIDQSAHILEAYKDERRLMDCRPLIKDFYDTATILLNLDLVITVDTALAHLAGALGKTVWVALPFSADWRWLKDRSDSPWYPTMTLFRQPSSGDWQSVFQVIKQKLALLSP
jgi:tetratricopeptide (TPR) repeat protein